MHWKQDLLLMILQIFALNIFLLLPKLPFLLLQRGKQKWSFAKYCPHFSFITLMMVVQNGDWKLESRLTSIPLTFPEEKWLNKK